MQRIMRLLRQKHHISVRELAGSCSLSHQRISQIELRPTPLTAGERKRIAAAFEGVLRQREKGLAGLSDDLIKYRDTLTDWSDKNGV